jgi:hypothetical protein
VTPARTGALPRIHSVSALPSPSTSIVGWLCAPAGIPEPFGAQPADGVDVAIVEPGAEVGGVDVETEVDEPGADEPAVEPAVDDPEAEGVTPGDWPADPELDVHPAISRPRATPASTADP